MITVREVTQKGEWDEYVQANLGHPLQLWGWGEVKSAHGWSAIRVQVIDDNQSIIGGAQILIKKMPRPLKAIAYIPRGPVVVKHVHSVSQAIVKYLKNTGAVALIAEPHGEVEKSDYRGWREVRRTILIPDTVVLDLQKSESELMSDMSKKTRQYIRKSEKEDGLVISRTADEDDVAQCLSVYKDTATRAGFRLHPDSYYEDVLRFLGDNSPIYVAKHNGTVVAFLWLASSRGVAFELYGGVSEEGQVLRANYALKWHAIIDQRSHGVMEYDLNGLLNDGISGFKRGFASHENKFVGTLEYPLNKYYSIWDKAFPAAKRIMKLIRSS